MDRVTKTTVDPLSDASKPRVESLAPRSVAGWSTRDLRLEAIESTLLPTD